MMKTIMQKSFIAVLVLGICLLSGEAVGGPKLTVSASSRVANFNYQILEGNRLLVSALDGDDNPVMALTPEDITIQTGIRKAKILEVEPLKTNKAIGLNIVLVVDNSFSMKEREAVEPLLAALEAFLSTVRPIDDVHVVVFDDKNTQKIGGLDLHVKTFNASDPKVLREFLRENLEEAYSNGTFLFDGIAAGLDIVRKMPKESNKFMVVFSDGKDINSSADEAIIQSSGAIDNFSAYTVDYLPQADLDPFLQQFAATHTGKIWKASSADEILPIFQSFSTTLLHRYVVTYRFLKAPEGRLAIGPAGVTIEEVTTIDSSPLLNFVYFDEGQSEIPAKYRLLDSQSQTLGFETKELKGTLEKHHHLLNVIGKRLRDNPQATIRLTGCNSDSGLEKGKLDLSKGRAESVKAYLRYIWGIAPDRITIDARNLPEKASTNRNPEGRAENQRVEIFSDTPSILAPVRTTYIDNICDTEKLTIAPQLEAEAGIASWQIVLKGDGTVIETLQGADTVPPEISIDLAAMGIENLASFSGLTAECEVVDQEGKAFVTHTESLPITFVQRKERVAQKQGYKVVERYALILFDFDSSDVKAQNQEIVDKIIARLGEVPQASVRITGHTDNIGSEEYNLELSQRRAQAVSEQMTTAPPSIKLSFDGAGPNSPLFSNADPEGRALNRTVTILLEYEAL